MRMVVRFYEGKEYDIKMRKNVSMGGGGRIKREQ